MKTVLPTLAVVPEIPYHSFNNYFLDPSYGLSTVLSSDDITVNKRDNTLVFIELKF